MKKKNPKIFLKSCISWNTLVVNQPKIHLIEKGIILQHPDTSMFCISDGGARWKNSSSFVWRAARGSFPRRIAQNFEMPQRVKQQLGRWMFCFSKVCKPLLFDSADPVDLCRNETYLVRVKSTFWSSKVLVDFKGPSRKRSYFYTLSAIVLARILNIHLKLKMGTLSVL